jgi:hypothetical protein
MQKDDELTPLTCDPELKRKWNRVLELERQLDRANLSTRRKIDELDGLKRELGIGGNGELSESDQAVAADVESHHQGPGE